MLTPQQMQQAVEEYLRNHGSGPVAEPADVRKRTGLVKPTINWSRIIRERQAPAAPVTEPEPWEDYPEPQGQPAPVDGVAMCDMPEDLANMLASLIQSGEWTLFTPETLMIQSLMRSVIGIQQQLTAISHAVGAIMSRQQQGQREQEQPAIMTVKKPDANQKQDQEAEAVTEARNKRVPANRRSTRRTGRNARQ